MGSSSIENSLISRLENFDYKGLHTAFSDYLQPFSDFIDFNNDDVVELPNNTKKKKKKKCTVDDPKLIRPLAKQFLPFISRALKVLPNKLSEPPKPGGGKKEEQIARQFFDIYRLCLDCLSCISSCLDCKPFHIHFQRIRMVHCLEAWGRYGEVESEGFSIFESLWSIDLVKGKKKKKKVEEGRFVPDLTTENAEPDLACLIMEIVVCIVKCAIKSQSKDEAVYNRVLSLVDQVTPWLRVMDSKAFERLHRVLVTNLYKCTLFMLGEDACFEGDLVHKFCTTTLSECLKSYTKDQFLKFAYNICSSLRSQWVNRPSLILDILQCVLESILCECKVDLEYTVNESLNLVHYCLKRCRIANRDTCRNIERHLEKTVGELVQIAGPIDSILRLYATGFHFMDNDFQSRYNGFANSDSSKSAVTFLLGIGDKLQDLSGLLHSLEGYFHIASNANHQSPGCAKKNSRNVPSAASVSNIECSSSCKNKHGKISLLSYLNAMEFFFHPFTELVNKTCIQNIPDKEAASLSTKIKYIQDALHQFCNVYFIAFSCTYETEKDRLNESRKTLLNAAVAAFILSLSSDKNIQKSVDCIDHIVSMVWIQSKEIKFLVSSLYNIGADLYNAKRLKLASIPLEVCCRASWTRILLLCKKFIQKSDRVFDDMSEESIVSLVTEACAKSITLLDVLHQCNSPDVYTNIVDSLSNWILARNLFNGLDVPALLVKKWVKIICKEFKDVDGENNAPTLYSLLLEPTIALEERTHGVPALLVKKWVKIMCKEVKDVDGENNAPSLYSLLLKPSIALEERTLSIISIIFEQELLTYEEMEAQNINLCRRMQLKIMDILLLNIYVSEDYCLQKSKMLIKKGRVVRTCGSEGMNSCITCLSEAICVLEQVNTSSESACRSAQAFHQLALAYCLRALCNQEARQNFEVILPDIDKALELWSSINWSVNVHPEMVIENAIPLLYCVVDLLSLKGYLKFHYDIYKLIIRFLKQKNIPLERCLAMLWADRRLFHSLCSSPVNEDFLVDFAEDFVVHSNSVGFWINCIKDSPELLIGFRQKFSLSDSSLAQLGHHHCESPLGSDVTLDEVREVASALISRGSAPTSAFLAGYLYYDLSERFISNGQLFQALSYAKEAFRLRTKLLQKKFVCTFRQQPKSTSETEEVTSQHEHDFIHLEVHGSVSIEVWPYTTDPYNSEGCILSQWNVLQCYLESLLQVGTIHEATGNATVAEALFLQGKHISCIEGLPVFRVAFASALGEIYYKKQHWDMADKELNSAKQILVDSSAIISCKRCKLTLEVTIDQRIGSLTKNRLNGTAMASSVNGLSLALDFYRSALKKLDLPEWKNSLSFSEETNPLGTKELSSQKAKKEGSHLIMVPKKSKTVSKHLSKEQTLKSSHMPMTRSRYRYSQNTCLQGADRADSEDPKPSSGLDASSMPEIECEEACKITNCWRCVIMKVMKCGTMQDFINMKWEYYRRKLSLRLLADIGKCIGVLGEIHKAHDFFWESINVLISRKTDGGTYSSIPRSLLLEFIGKERRWDIFAVERASILYNISWFSLRIQLSEYSRISCHDLSCIQIEPIVSSLLQAFILCRELPLLFQKVCRLLSVIFLLSTCGGPFSLPRYICKVLSGSHWAAYFHQASLGTYLNHQFLSNPNGQLNSCNFKDFEGSHATGSAETAPETCNLLRLAPERIDDLKKFVIDFFQGLPSVTSICISLLGGEFPSLLSDVLPFPSSFPAWILLSRLNSNAQPIVMILPADLISEEALDNDTSSCQGSIPVGKDSSKKWHCPWGYTIVDDVAPQFKLILEENYLSSSISPTLDTQGNRMLWWTWRRKLNERLDKFLRDVEQSWLGPWNCLLLGEPSDCEHLRTVVSKLNADLKHKCQLDVNENLLRIILGGAMSVPQIEACISQLLMHKGYYVGKGGCWEKKYAPDYEEVGSISLLPQQLILEAASKLGNECIDREPIVLVLDSEVQMLPWENLPVLRNQEAYRMPSVGSISVILSISCHLEEKIGGVAANFPAIDPLDAFYLLNPSGDLNCTQIEFEEWFRDQKLEGKAGTPPTTEELVIALKNHDLFIYFGHGSGTQYIPGYEIQKLKNCAATFLMGCSSGTLSLMGCYNPQGAVLSYLLAGSPAIVANLWEVTDKDIDRFGKAMLNSWLEERSTCSTGTAQCSLVAKEFESMNIRSSKGNTKRKVTRGKKMMDGSHCSTCKVCCGHRPMIGSFMSQAREACTLPLLIGASPVCYGVPTSIRKKKDL